MQDSWNPNQYHQFAKERSQPFYDLLALVQPIANGSAVDLGCGSGELTRELHEKLRLHKTLGLDTSDKMLAQAAKHASSGLEFQKSSIEDFAARASSDHAPSYDLIFSNAALQWCADHERLIQIFYEALKPGGQLAIQMPNNHAYPTHRLADEMMREEPYRAFFKKDSSRQGIAPVHALEEYARWLYRAGFREQNVLARVYAHVLPNREAVIEWVKGSLLTSFQANLPPEIYPLFEGEYRSRLFEELADEEPFFYPFRRIFLWARV